MSRRQRRQRQIRRERNARAAGLSTRHSLVTGATISAGALLGLSSTAAAATFDVDRGKKHKSSAQIAKKKCKKKRK